MLFVLLEEQFLFQSAYWQSSATGGREATVIFFSTQPGKPPRIFFYISLKWLEVSADIFKIFNSVRFQKARFSAVSLFIRGNIWLRKLYFIFTLKSIWAIYWIHYWKWMIICAPRLVISLLSQQEVNVKPWMFPDSNQHISKAAVTWFSSYIQSLEFLEINRQILRLLALIKKCMSNIFQ